MSEVRPSPIHVFATLTMYLASGYPPTHILAIFPHLPPPISQIVQTLLKLFTLLLPHSSTSGLTPTLLSTYFSLLLFTPPSTSHSHSSFHQSHQSYILTSHACEHLLLSWVIYEQYRQKTQHGLEIPPKLASWVVNYPKMLPGIGGGALRKGAKTRRVLATRRNVRFYSSDLVKYCASWASIKPSNSPSSSSNFSTAPASRSAAATCAKSTLTA